MQPSVSPSRRRLRTRPLAAAERVAPDVSVIVPIFNKAAYLAECLDSVLGQSLANIEVICVDDASTDESPTILTRYAARDARLHVVRTPSNRGPGPARNLGIAMASARYVQFTDADDVLPETALEQLHRRARAGQCSAGARLDGRLPFGRAVPSGNVTCGGRRSRVRAAG